MLRHWPLTLSISLNLFLAALIGAHWLDRPPPHHGPPGRPDPMRMAEDLAQALPPADGAILRAAFAAHTAALPAQVVHGADPMDAVRRTLSADPFDRGALEAALADLQAGREAMEAAIGAALLDAATRMSPEGRRHLGEMPPPRHRPPPPP